jgi:hypothetical protein
MTRSFGSNPGIISRVFNTLDTTTTAYQTVTYDPTVPLPDFDPVVTEDVPH